MAALALGCGSLAANAGRPPLQVPRDPGTILEHLPRGYAALVPQGAQADAAPVSMAQVDALIETAARTGDARLATRAEALLARLPAKLSHTPDAIHARVFTTQHRHDFTGALKLLDARLAQEPGDGYAHLSRASIQLVQGRIREARAECTTLALNFDTATADECIAALSLRTGAYPTAEHLVDLLLQQPGLDPATARYLLVTRAEAASRSGEADADTWFEKALAIDPEDVRTLAAYARQLRAHGENRRVVDLLAHAPDTDALRLQLTLAVHAMGLPQAGALIDSQGRRYDLAHAVGTQPEMRDEAEYMLTLRGNAQAALALAQRNFESQRDVEDVDILRRSAIAAHRPDVLASLRKWAASQQLPIAGDKEARR